MGGRLCDIANQCLELNTASMLLQVGTYNNQGYQHFSLSPAGPAGTVTISFASIPAGGVLTSFSTDGAFLLSVLSLRMRTISAFQTPMIFCVQVPKSQRMNILASVSIFALSKRSAWFNLPRFLIYWYLFISGATILFPFHICFLLSISTRK